MKPDSVNIDEKEKALSITLNPRLYSQSTVMRAAYRFIDDFDVVVDGDPLSKIFVAIKLKPEDKQDATKEDLDKLASAFFSELIHANVEESQARRYADTRNALIGAALRNLMVNATPEAIENLGKKPQAREKERGFDTIYKYMPKQNCGKCGANCETTAKKILSGEAGVDACIHLKKPEFSVPRSELESALSAMKNKNGCYDTKENGEKC